jgi:1,4-dihydroxy-2-naphthoate octaprenyltransferase
MTTTRLWIAGARPRTLPAALAPVLVGTAVAMWDGGAVWDRALLALVVALALQVGVNYANDYSDGIRGTDAERVGPVRLVGQGLAEPAAVKRAALLSFAVAGAAGLVLVLLSGLWWLLLVGAAAIVAAWTYTGGPRPYGYAGLGEVFVFVFFGLVAVGGTAAVQVGFISALAWVCGLGVGALSCAILVVNNLRDIPGDTVAGKRTLAVRIGDPATRRL